MVSLATRRNTSVADGVQCEMSRSHVPGPGASNGGTLGIVDAVVDEVVDDVVGDVVDGLWSFLSVLRSRR
jgi:hypothetical protein